MSIPGLLVRLAGIALASSVRAGAIQSASPTRTQEIARGVYLFSEPAANVLVMPGKDGILVVGEPGPSLGPSIRALLDSLRASGPTYVLVTSGGRAAEQVDVTWAKGEARIIAHEAIRKRMMIADSGVRKLTPSFGFSELLQIAINEDEVHAVHQPAGFSDSDLSVHFHVREFVYLGNLFTTDGYPSIDLERGGSVNGLIQSIGRFLDMFGGTPALMEPIVPGRGPLATTAELRAYHHMLVAVHQRVEKLVAAGKTIQEVISSRPTQAFDARWGHGQINPETFVGMVYRSIASASHDSSDARLRDQRRPAHLAF